jgi:hypothetical protein
MLPYSNVGDFAIILAFIHCDFAIILTFVPCDFANTMLEYIYRKVRL